MASTNSAQAHYDAEPDFPDLTVTRPADPGYYTSSSSSDQIYNEGNDQAATPIQGEDFDKYLPLLRAAAKGDWEKAKEFFEKYPEAVTAIINSDRENALYVAVQAGNKAIDFVKHLVEEMPIEALEHKNVNGRTVLICAAFAGNKHAAEILVQKHSRLLYIPDNHDYLPVNFAADYGRKDTFKYLLSVTEEEQYGVRPFEGKFGVALVVTAIYSGYYGEALKLIHSHPKLATLQHPVLGSVLLAIAVKARFKSGSHLTFWERAIYSCVPVKLDECAKELSQSDIEDPEPKHNLAQTFVKSFYIPGSPRLQVMLYKVLAFLVPHIKHIGNKKQELHQAALLVKLVCQQIMDALNEYGAYDYGSIVKEALFFAAKSGVAEVVEEILDSFPNVVGIADRESHLAFDLAILNRQEKVLKITNHVHQLKVLMYHHYDDKRNNALHLVARQAPPSRLNRVPGAALQMQRELQWFKEVEKFVSPIGQLVKNKSGETPAELFTKEHKDLVREGEKWMKDAANSCTIVASLIATIAFVAAITGPGGNDDKSGLPIFSKESAFIIFAISNALSLFASATSLLMFLSILTSRYQEDDFLYVLHNNHDGSLHCYPLSCAGQIQGMDTNSFSRSSYHSNLYFHILAVPSSIGSNQFNIWYHFCQVT